MATGYEIRAIRLTGGEWGERFLGPEEGGLRCPLLGFPSNVIMVYRFFLSEYISRHHLSSLPTKVHELHLQLSSTALYGLYGCAIDAFII